MESQFAEYLIRDPDVFYITRSRIQNGVICYSESIFQKNTLINSLHWVYQNYFLKSVTVFLPKIKSNGDYLICDLETLEKTDIQTGTVVIFGYADLIFGDLAKINKIRLNTVLKIILKKAIVVILSSCSLKILDLSALDQKNTKFGFDYLELSDRPLINYRTLMDHISLFDLMDPKVEEYSNNVDPFVEMVSDFVNSGKRIYLSLGLSIQRLVEIESKFKNLGHSVLRKDSDSADIVINSSKTCGSTFLFAKYDIYFFAPEHFNNSVELIYQFKSTLGNRNIEIYLDSTRIDNTEKCLKDIFTTSHVPRTVIKDSADFESYSELVDSLDKSQEIVLASDDYYTVNYPDNSIDLKNLQKKDYDRIREFVKVYLLNKYDLEVKTVQLAAPCSPRDRSRKLNSLANKISSFDYRCNVTIEIFKDYTIGIVIWNETFANRKALNLKLLKNCGYVYQTTYNKWKYTLIN
jgi:hypothetical protein